MAVATIHVRVKPEIKAEAERILKEIGISMSDYINMSLKRLIIERKIPFNTQIPNDNESKNT